MAFDPLRVVARVLAAEAEALAQLAAAPPAGVADAVRILLATKGRVVVTGMGKSGHVGRKIAATLSSTGRPAFFLHPGEASHGDLGALTDRDAVIALSWSGETAELSDVVAHARRLGAPIVAITAEPASMLAKASTVALILPKAPEACRVTAAPTTSTVLQLALGDALAVAQLEATGFTATDFRIRHPGGKLGAMLARVGDVMVRGAALPLIGPDADLPATLLEMGAKRLGCVGVVEEGRLVGMITDGDVRRAMDREGGTAAASAGAIMTPDPMTLDAETAVADALVAFNERKITNAFVVDAAGAPTGAVHIHDLLRLGL